MVIFALSPSSASVSPLRVDPLQRAMNAWHSRAGADITPRRPCHMLRSGSHLTYAHSHAHGLRPERGKQSTIGAHHSRRVSSTVHLVVTHALLETSGDVPFAPDAPFAPAREALARPATAQQRSLHVRPKRHISSCLRTSKPSERSYHGRPRCDSSKRPWLSLYHVSTMT